MFGKRVRLHQELGLAIAAIYIYFGLSPFPEILVVAKEGLVRDPL